MIADHGWRRRLLGDRLGQTPSELSFAAGEHGKPSLVGGRTFFSASRSEDVAWYAICDQAEVGVDVERIDHERPLTALARRLLGPHERARYEALAPADRPRALGACWTCKEAAVKALGTGLVFPLTALEVWAGDGTPVRTHGLEVRELPAGRDRTAAVAVHVADDGPVVIQAVVDLDVR